MFSSEAKQISLWFERKFKEDFQISVNDQCLFVKDGMYILFYLYDNLISRQNDSDINKIKDNCSSFIIQDDSW